MSCRVEALLCRAVADFLKFAEGHRVFFAMTPKPGLLDGEIFQLAFIHDMNFGFDQVLADGFVVVGEELPDATRRYVRLGGASALIAGCRLWTLDQRPRRLAHKLHVAA